MQSLLGQTLGQYRIVEQLGKGGMATVYKAFQPSLERFVAIKVLPPYFAHQEGFGERFVREAKAIARLDHPHILPIHDYGREGDISYIVMKYVDAGTLKDLEGGARLALEQALQIVQQIAEALDYAHGQGIIHRDVKPGNVLMDHGTWVLLTDFGLAKMAEGSQQLTGSGVGVGTPAYMAPEQGQGRPVDGRADVYALGIVLYEMLTGRVPYEAETPLAVVLRHVTDPLPLPRLLNPQIPEAVEQVILKALAKDPEERYGSAGDMATALSRAMEDAKGIATLLQAAAEPTAAQVPTPQPTDVVAEAVELPAFGQQMALVEPPAPADTAQATARAASPTVPEDAVRLARRGAAPPPVPTDIEASPTEVRAAKTGPQAAPAIASQRRVPWWAVVVGLAAVLVFVLVGIRLSAGVRLRRARLALALTSAAQQQPTPTLSPTQQASSSGMAGEPIRVGLVGNPESDVTATVSQVAQYLSERLGVLVELVPAGESMALDDLVRSRRVDAAVLMMQDYLWLRQEGLSLDPLLYREPTLVGIVVVRADSDIGRAEQLRGQRVAMASWNTYAAILGRAALMDSGLSVDKECEPVYLGPDFDAELSFQALEMVLDGRVAAAIVPGSAIEKIGERVPAAQGKLRVLVESSPTSAGVVAAWADLPKDRAAALQTALQEMDREWLSSLTLYERLAPADRPLAENLEAALRKVGLDAGQLARNEPPQPWTPPQASAPAQAKWRVALVPGAGMSVQASYALRVTLYGLQSACAEYGLALDDKETPAEGSPADTARGLVESGYNILVAMGWREPESFWALAREHGQARFVYSGSQFADPLPNLVSLTYRADEAGFLAGALAGKASQSRKVAVIGGQHVPAVEQLVAGFANGVRYACPGCEPVVRFTDSVSDLALGEKTGRELVHEGVDVILNAAGLCGSAGIRAAVQEGAWAIGIDVDEYVTTFRKGEVPKADHLLGSVVFQMGEQARQAVVAIVRGSPASGNLTVGVAESGVEFVPSPAVAHPQRQELDQYLKQVSQDLRDGKIRP